MVTGQYCHISSTSRGPQSPDPVLNVMWTHSDLASHQQLLCWTHLIAQYRSGLVVVHMKLRLEPHPHPIMTTKKQPSSSKKRKEAHEWKLRSCRAVDCQGLRRSSQGLLNGLKVKSRTFKGLWRSSQWLLNVLRRSESFLEMSNFSSLQSSDVWPNW